MPQKSIYVKDEDLNLWEEVKKIIGDESLSEIVVEGLRRVIDARKAAINNLKRIVLEVGISEEPHYSIGFYGKEIASYCDEERDCPAEHTAYITKKGYLLIYTEEGDSIFEQYHKIFHTVAEAAKEKNRYGEPNYPSKFLGEIAEEMGETFIVELDV